MPPVAPRRNTAGVLAPLRAPGPRQAPAAPDAGGQPPYFAACRYERYSANARGDQSASRMRCTTAPRSRCTSSASTRTTRNPAPLSRRSRRASPFCRRTWYAPSTFDNEPRHRRKKINDETRQHHLPPKRHAKLAGPKRLPQPSLRRRRPPPQLMSETSERSDAILHRRNRASRRVVSATETAQRATTAN